MPSANRLRSVAHSIAHHSVSGLCYLHPHLGQACKESGSDRFEIDLRGRSSISEFERTSSAINGAAIALREKFAGILQSENMTLSDLSEAFARFHFNRVRWPSSCHVRVVSNAGRAIDVAVDQMGNPAEIVD